MIVFPNCKINLGLHILQKRPDGFHNLETIFYPFPLTDALEIIRNDSGQTALGLSGLALDAKPGDNICLKAYFLLKTDFPDLPAVKMHLHKTIPTGAGLGGGSSDGAFTLLLLNRKFNLGLSEESLIAYALQLGSDCPFFIRNRACYATGRGEIMEYLPLDLSPFSLVLVNPGIHISTAWAFSQLKPSPGNRPLKEFAMRPVSEWKDQVVNDFEAPVFHAQPEVAEIKRRLYELGAVYASMSGSGSTVYGLFEKKAVPAFEFPSQYQVVIR